MKKQLYATDLNYHTGCTIKGEFITRNYFSVDGGVSANIIVHDMQFMLGREFINKNGIIEWTGKYIMKQISTMTNEAKWLSETSDEFLHIKKHGVFLIEHYSPEEIKRLRALKFSLPLCSQELIDKLYGRISEVKLNTKCTIYSKTGMGNNKRNVIITHETESFLYYENYKGIDKDTDHDFNGRFKKSDIDIIQYLS